MYAIFVATVFLLKKTGVSFWNPNPHTQGKHMNKSMAAKLSSLPGFEAFWVIICPEYCSYFCFVCGGGGGHSRVSEECASFKERLQQTLENKGVWTIHQPHCGLCHLVAKTIIAAGANKLESNYVVWSDDCMVCFATTQEIAQPGT